MIVVKIELHSAVTKKITTLGSMIISNVGVNGKKADYDVRVGRKPDAENIRKVYADPLRTGSVKNYPRLSYNVWRLVVRSLLSAFPEEKG